jgi:hypothetical protein
MVGMRIRPALPSEPAALPTPRLVNELATHQVQQICFGIAATDGHYARVVRVFERNSFPAFAPPRGWQASPKYAGKSARAYLEA